MWSAWAEFASGGWDEATAAAERAVSLLEESGHEWLRPLARLAAVLVPAARGEWAAAEEHARAAVARSGDYELMVAAAGLAQAQVLAARGDHDGVLRALEPVVASTEPAGVDEPGFWPWQDLYGEALVGAGRLAEAERFLVPREQVALARGRGSMVARVGTGAGAVGGGAGAVAGGGGGVRWGGGGVGAVVVAVSAGADGARVWAGVAAGGAAAGRGGAVDGGAGAFCGVAGAAVCGAV